MSKKILLGTAALIALGTAAFTGTALADDTNNSNAVGCSASNQQNGNLIPVNVLGDLANGNNILSNCSATSAVK